MGKESEHSAGGSQSVRSSCEAGNDRGAKGTQEGGSMTDRTTDQEPKRVPARAYRRRNQPGAIDLVGTESLDVMLGDEAKSRSLSTEHPPTGKPDAGEPPVRFGGRGGGHPLSLPYQIDAYYCHPCICDKLGSFGENSIFFSNTPPTPSESSLPDSWECKRDKRGRPIYGSGGRPRLP